LVEDLEQARDAVPADDPGGRIMAWAQTLRAWALANPEGFRLIYGDPVPGYQPPEGGPASGPEHRACGGLTGLVAAAWAYAEPLQSGDYTWADFGPGLVGQIQDE